jgi:PilZ domain
VVEQPKSAGSGATGAAYGKDPASTTRTFRAVSRDSSSLMRSPMTHLAKAYGEVHRRARFELQLCPAEGAKWFTVTILGVSRVSGHLIVSAPQTPDRALIAVSRGNTLSCSWANSAYLFKFRATITNLAFEPTPLVYLGRIQGVRRQTVRAESRALTALSAALHVPAAQAALITDLSTLGARIGTATALTLKAGQPLKLTLRPRMLGRDFEMTLRCTLASSLAAADPLHPHVQFYGLKFQNISNEDRLTLHAYVQERLALEGDFLSQLLLSDAGPVESTLKTPKLKT